MHDEWEDIFPDDYDPYGCPHDDDDLMHDVSGLTEED